MKIAVTSASGASGLHLASTFLGRRGTQLLLFLGGRNPNRLRELFPYAESCCFDDLAQRIGGYDSQLHRAVPNNNVEAGPEEHFEATVNLTKTVLLGAQQAGARRFVYASTTYAPEELHASSYASSKRMTSARVAATEHLDVHILYLSAVMGQQLMGRMEVFQ